MQDLAKIWISMQCLSKLEQKINKLTRFEVSKTTFIGASISIFNDTLRCHKALIKYVKPK